MKPYIYVTTEFLSPRANHVSDRSVGFLLVL